MSVGPETWTIYRNPKWMMNDHCGKNNNVHSNVENKWIPAIDNDERSPQKTACKNKKLTRVFWINCELFEKFIIVTT